MAEAVVAEAVVAEAVVEAEAEAGRGAMRRQSPPLGSDSPSSSDTSKAMAASTVVRASSAQVPVAACLPGWTLARVHEIVIISGLTTLD